MYFWTKKLISKVLKISPETAKRRVQQLEDRRNRIPKISFGHKDEPYYFSDEIVLPKYHWHWRLLSIAEKDFYLNYKEEQEKIQTVGEPRDMDNIPKKFSNFKKILWKTIERF